MSYVCSTEKNQDGYCCYVFLNLQILMFYSFISAIWWWKVLTFLQSMKLLILCTHIWIYIASHRVTCHNWNWHTFQCTEHGKSGIYFPFLNSSKFMTFSKLFIHKCLTLLNPINGIVLGRRAFFQHALNYFSYLCSISTFLECPGIFGGYRIYY